MFYVYILKWSRYYVGYTNNLDLRYKQHREGKTKSTNRYWDLSLLWYFIFEKKSDAMMMEREIKKSGHIDRYLIHNDFIKI